jgi:hypothetical protein
LRPWRARGEDIQRSGGIALLCAGDQIRMGAATNAVQIAELLLGWGRDVGPNGSKPMRGGVPGGRSVFFGCQIGRSDCGFAILAGLSWL